MSVQFEVLVSQTVCVCERESEAVRKGGEREFRNERSEWESRKKWWKMDSNRER